MDYSYDNPDCLWVNPDVFDDGTGLFEQPFASLEAALERVKPGQAVVLQAGVYTGDCNIQVSGTPQDPIRIVAMPGAEVVVRNSCWFFYDTSDLVVGGMSFVDAPLGAISVIGACSRNRFDGIRFVHCGARKETVCTLYIGGAGGGCNVVENCTFIGGTEENSVAAPSDASIGLMIAQGDAEHGSPIVNCLVRRNRFEHYAYGIVAGGDESRSVRCGHIIEYNSLSDCFREGILVKSGDTLIRSNVIEAGTGTALSLSSRIDGTVEANRIVDCRRGVFVQGDGHSVSGNCIVRCGDGAVRVGGASEEFEETTSNCFIERNTFINCGGNHGGTDGSIAGVLVDKGTTGIIQRNLIVGCGKPYAVVETADVDATAAGITQFVIRDNMAAEGCTLLEGVGEAVVVFTDTESGDYRNESGSGATGWVLTPQGFDPSVDREEEEGVYRAASVLEDDRGNPIIPGSEDVDEERLFGRYFSGADDDEENPESDDGDDTAALSDGDNEAW